MAEFQLTVNGERQRVDAEPEMPLLWVLRDVLGLRGTKASCAAGLCGVCTVLLDGEPLRSCVTPVGDVADRQVLTIEGLSESGDHPVQQAWLAKAVSQCGWCQPGQIMTAVALLGVTSTPTDADIDEAFDSSLCRCGTYLRIRAAVHAAARGMT